MLVHNLLQGLETWPQEGTFNNRKNHSEITLLHRRTALTRLVKMNTHKGHPLKAANAAAKEAASNDDYSFESFNASRTQDMKVTSKPTNSTTTEDSSKGHL